MSVEQVRAYLKRWNRDKDVVEMGISTATVELAAAALSVTPARIAKTISLRNSSESGAMLIVAAGDMKIDNRKFRSHFNFKPRMLGLEEVSKYTGHTIGGVCPFALPAGLEVYLDNSLKRFQTIFPACGSGNSLIELRLSELEEYSQSRGWIDICVSLSERAPEPE
jgi:prolyl-tRNA editing enzyme YbaK/EbsC (Cys-tRNA(Pro) deacylase)